MSLQTLQANIAKQLEEFSELNQVTVSDMWDEANEYINKQKES